MKDAKAAQPRRTLFGPACAATVAPGTCAPLLRALQSGMVLSIMDDRDGDLPVPEHRPRDRRDQDIPRHRSSRHTDRQWTDREGRHPGAVLPRRRPEVSCAHPAERDRMGTGSPAAGPEAGCD